MAVGVFEFGGVELDGVVLHHLEGFLGDVGHLHEPLGRELGFDDGVGALGVAHLVGVVLNFFDEAGGFEVLDNLFAADEAVETGVGAAFVVEGAVVVEDVDGFEAVFHADVVVVDVVGGCDFEGARAELAVHILVHDNLHAATHTGNDDAMSLEGGIAGVVGVDAHGGVAEDGLGAGGGHHDVLPLVVGPDTRLFAGGECGAVDVVAEVEEFAVAFLIDHLFVGDGGEGFGVPVDHADAAVDEAFVVEVDEDADDTFVADGVHGEGGAVPVAGGAEFTELLEYDAAVFLLPLPGVFHELVAGEVALVDAPFLEHIDHLGFGGDGGVVGAGHPAGVEPHHAGAAHEDVLYGVVEHVAHVEYAGDVGRRYDYGV